MSGFMPGMTSSLKFTVKRARIAGTSGTKTRGACHQAALRADPLALLSGDDD
jgi:hypothetical protein